MAREQTLKWFKFMYRKARVMKSPNFHVYKNRKFGGQERVAIVVPNSSTPLASKRNLVKRRIKTILNLMKEEIVGMDYVIVVKRDVSRFQVSELTNELSQLIV